MALPDNTISTEVVKGRFLYPDNIVPQWFEDYEMGGIALQDPSQGLEYQPWYGSWNAETGDISLRPNIIGAPIVILNEPDVVDFTFTFDQNMRWSVAILTSTGVVRFHWYDSLVAAYVVTTYPGMRSVKLCLDDKRAIQVLSDRSDILLSYVSDADILYVRTQRERYLIEYSLSPDIPSNVVITNFGMTDIKRVQWRFQNLPLGA